MVSRASSIRNSQASAGSGQDEEARQAALAALDGEENGEEDKSSTGDADGEGEGGGNVDWVGTQASGENAFTCLRDAVVLSNGVENIEGWMLKRGDKFANGRWNSWKLRYFRQEGNDLVYYTQQPESGRSAAPSVQVDNSEEGAAAAEGDASKITDPNLKGAMVLSEIVQIDLR